MDTVIRELLPQQQPRTIERRDLQYITISKEELTSSDSLSPDPWKRDAREKAEKQQQLHIVDLLDKEIQELQVGTVYAPFRSSVLVSLKEQFSVYFSSYLKCYLSIFVSCVSFGSFVKYNRLNGNHLVVAQNS